MPNRLQSGLILLLLLIFNHGLQGQAYSKADSTQIWQLLDKADELYVSGTFESVLEKANEAFSLSSSKKMLRGQAFARLKIASVWLRKDEGHDITPDCNEAIRIGLLLKDSFLLALAHYEKGQYLMFDGQDDEAEKLFKKSLALNFNKISSGHKGHVYNDLGYLYGKRGDVEQQVNWLLQAIRIHEQTGDHSQLAVAQGNLAAAYNSLGNRAEAINYTKRSISIKESMQDMDGLALSYNNLSNLMAAVSLDSASFYQEKAVVCASRNNLRSALVNSYTNLSAIYDLKAGRSDRDVNKREALAYILKAIELCREVNDEAATASKLRWAGQLSGDLNDTAAMENYFRQARAIAETRRDKPALRDIYGAMAISYERKKNYGTALENLKMYYRYRDSLTTEKTATNIAELQTKYETEKKDNEISRLETDQRLKQLSIEKQDAIIAGDRLLAEQKETEIHLLSQQQLLRDARIEQQEEELDKQQLIARNSQQALLLASQEKEIRNKQIDSQHLQRNLMIGGTILLAVFALVVFNRFQLKKKLQQQRELLAVRNHIALDLHDEIGSTLTSIRILSQVSQKNLVKDQQKAGSMLEQITEQSTRMQQGMSDIVWAISPLNDKLENIVVRMREYIRDTLEPHGVTTTLNIPDSVQSANIGMEQRRDLFLIFKEAVNNVTKYAGAKNVSITFSREHDLIRMEIGDDGIGFDPGLARSSNGLKNMAARAEALKGTCNVRSTMGEGTKVVIEFPHLR